MVVLSPATLEHRQGWVFLHGKKWGSQAANQPPSTGRIAPLIKPASLDARKAMAAASSSGVATREGALALRNGYTLLIPASLGTPLPIPMAVATAPGQTAL